MRAALGIRGRLSPQVALLGLVTGGIVGSFGVMGLSASPAHAQNSPATINSGPVTWGEGGGASFLIDKVNGTAGTNWSLNNITGTLTFSSGYTAASTFTLDITSIVYQGDGMDTGIVGPATNFNPSQDYTWTFVHTTGGVVGYDPAKVTLDPSSFQANNATNGGQFFLALLGGGNDVALKFINASELPEPSALPMLVLGCAGALPLALHRRARARRA